MFSALFLLALPFARSQSDIPLSNPIQNVLATKNDLYTYPTNFTQGIIPKNIHSHNDYWRPKPFYSGLSVGAISTEADVWLYNGTLYVGHEESALTHERTFDALYIQPILSVLKGQNPSSPFVTKPTKNGVFDTSSAQPLFLFVDVKTDGPTTWPYVVKALEPLRQGGWLHSLNGTTFTNGTVVVIGTGNTPRDQVESKTQRDYFWDGPLPDLAAQNVTQYLSPIASTSFNSQFGVSRDGTLNSTMLTKLRKQISSANDRGILVRYWDTPSWPVNTRDAIWRLLWNEGAYLINADDIWAAANFWEN